MLMLLTVGLALASDPCVDQCTASYDSCANLAAAGCGVAGKATERVAGKALGSVPLGGLLAKGAGASAKAVCEEKLAPCREKQATCVEACGTGEPPAGVTPGVGAMAMPSPLLIFGTEAGAQVWIDGQRAGVLPASASEPYASPPLTPGAHTVRVQAGGGRSWEKVVMVVSGGINSVEVGAMLSDDRRRLVALLVLGERGELAEAIEGLVLLGGGTADADLRVEAEAARARFTEALAGLEAAARAETEAARVAEEATAERRWAYVLSLQSDRFDQRRAAEDWLGDHADQPQAAEARELVDEIDGLVAAELATEMAALSAYSMGSGRRKRLEAGRMAGAAYSRVEPEGLERFVVRAAADAGVWAPSSDGGSLRGVYKAEQRRRQNGFWLLYGSYAVVGLGSFWTSELAWELREPSQVVPLTVAMTGLTTALGTGVLMSSEPRHAFVRKLYGPALPAAGSMPAAGATLISIGAGQAIMGGVWSAIGDERHDCTGYYSMSCEEREEWLAADSTAASVLIASGGINVALGLTAAVLHRREAKLHALRFNGTGVSGGF
jgi:hypothetical protein